jgi:O-antigen/teichoic acid export membrane protein
VRGVLRRVSYLSGANLVNGILGVVFVPVAVHRLGPAGYGLFSIYGVLVGYVVLVELGLGKNLVRVLAGIRDEEERRRQLQLAWGLYLTVTLVLVVLAPVAAWLVPAVLFPVEPAQRAAVAWISVFAIADYVIGVPVSLRQNLCVADERFDRYSRYIVASGLLRYGVGFSAVFVFANPTAVVGALALRRFGDVGLARWLMGPLPPGSWRPRFDRRRLARMVGHSSALSLAQLLQITVVSVGSIIVNYLFGLRALGVYRAVFDLVSKVWFLSNVVGSVLFPRFVRLLSEPRGRERLAGILPSVLQLSWLGFSLLAVGGIAVGPWVLARIGLAGGEYAGLFVTLMVGVSFNAHTNLSYEFLQATGRYAVVVGLAAVSLAALLAVFFVLSGAVGVLAIGWAWLVSQIAYALAADATVLRALAALRMLGGREVLARAVGLSAVLLFVGGGLGGGTRYALAGAAAGLVAALLTVEDLRRLRAQPRPAAT